MIAINSILPGVVNKYRKYLEIYVSDKFKCLLCSQLLVNALQTDCGCRYCQECLEEYFAKGNKKCLSNVCGDIKNTIPDNAINREISCLLVKCLYPECAHEDKLINIGDHLDSCIHQTVNCSFCDKQLTKNTLKEHVERKFPMRVVNCQHCDQSMTDLDLKESHLNYSLRNLCPKLEGICPFNCDNRRTVNLLNHREICSKKPTVCPYSRFGCDKIVAKENLTAHINEEVVTHLSLVMNDIVKMKSDTNELVKFQAEFSDKFKTSEASTCQRSLLNSTEENIIYRNGVFIWKIERFSQLKLNAERGIEISLTSNPFLTEDFGYKMCMRIYPAGDDVGKGTHLSVFFVLMKGEYDGLLRWPFKKKVTLAILDQTTKKSHHSETFKPDVRSSCYQQPTTEYNIANGNSKFITFDRLNGFYVTNDTIFLEIAVLN